MKRNEWVGIYNPKKEIFDYISESSDGMILVSDISDESVADDRINWE